MSSRSSKASAWYMGDRSKCPPSARICSASSRFRSVWPFAHQRELSGVPRSAPANIKALIFFMRWFAKRCVSSRASRASAWIRRPASRAWRVSPSPRASALSAFRIRNFSQLTIRKESGYGSHPTSMPVVFCVHQSSATSSALSK